MKNTTLSLIAGLLLVLIFPMNANAEKRDKGTNVFENIRIGNACINGFSVATYFFGEKENYEPRKQGVMNMLYLACISDDYVLSLYNSMKNGKDAKTLDETRSFLQKQAEQNFYRNIEVLKGAKSQQNRG